MIDTSFANREAVRGLVANFDDYFLLTRQAVDRAKTNPSDRLSVLAGFLFVNHLRDWASRDDVLPSALKSSPFYEAIREVANGTKHLVLKASSHPDPHATEIKTISGYGMGAYGVGPYGKPYIYLQARRRAEDEEYLYTAGIILGEALEWWAAALAPIETSAPLPTYP
jgi:hypothetical protein